LRWTDGTEETYTNFLLNRALVRVQSSITPSIWEVELHIQKHPIQTTTPLNPISTLRNKIQNEDSQSCDVVTQDYHCISQETFQAIRRETLLPQMPIGLQKQNQNIVLGQLIRAITRTS
jgi:hypothetical protein